MVDSTKVKVSLTPRNVSRLRNGHTVQLKNDQISGCGANAHSHTIHLSGVYAKKFLDAKRKNTGVKIQMTPQEIQASGLKDVLKTVGRVYRKDIRPIVGPVLKQAVSQGIKQALPAIATATGNPELVPVAAALANQIATPATNAIGRVTGAYGLKKDGKYKELMAHLPLADHSSGGYRKIKGGSFKPA